MANPTTVVINLTGSDKTGAAWASANKRVANHRRKVKGLLGTYQRIKTNIVQMNSALGLMPVAGMAGMAASASLFAKSVLSARTEMNSFNNSMLVATGSSKAGAKEFKKVTKLSRKLGLDLGTTADSYRKFSISARAAGLSQRDTSSVFEGVSTAIGAIGLSSEKSSRVFMALEQMMSKGTVSAEELKQQMGEHLPGSMSIAAKAMGLTTREFQKALAAGQIMSDDFLPKFAKALKEKFGEAAIKASKQFRGAFNNMASAWLEFKLAVGDKKFMDAAAKAVTKLTSILKDPATIKGVKAVFNAMIDGFTWMMDNEEKVKNALIAIGIAMLTLTGPLKVLGAALVFFGIEHLDDLSRRLEKSDARKQLKQLEIQLVKMKAGLDLLGKATPGTWSGLTAILTSQIAKTKELIASHKELDKSLERDFVATPSSAVPIIDEEEKKSIAEFRDEAIKVAQSIDDLFTKDRGSELTDAMTNARQTLKELQVEFAEGFEGAQVGKPHIDSKGQTFIGTEEDIEQITAMQEAMGGMGEQLEEINELSFSFGSTWLEMAEEMLPVWQEIGETLAEIFGPDGVLITGIAEAASSAILFGTSFGDSMKTLAKTIASTVLTMLIKLGIQSALNFAKDLFFTKASTAAEVAASTTKATTATAAATAAMTAIGAEAIALGIAAAPAAAAISLVSYGANAGPAIAGITLTHAVSKALSFAAEGGSFKAGDPIIIGEKGPELFIPKSAGDIIPNDVAFGQSRGGATQQQAQPLAAATQVANIEFNVTAMDSESFQEGMAKNSEVIIDIIRDAFNTQGEEVVI